MISKSLPRVLATALCLALFSGFGQPAVAQTHGRINSPIGSVANVPIPQSIHPRVKLGIDLGPTAGDRVLHGVTIRFNMTDTQQAALDQLLNDQQNPASPRYHQWLTPEQYAAQFGMAPADLAKVSAWLTAQGFKVTGTARGGTFIAFDGTVAQVQQAFATSIHNLSVNGETHFANVSNISVPSAFAGTVAAVSGLHDFRLQPRVHTAPVDPRFTSSISGSHFVAPGDIYTIYNVNPLLATYNGTGVTLAVTGQVDINVGDLTAFRTAAGLSTANLPTTVHANGCDPGLPNTATTCNRGTSEPEVGDLAESSLDLEWSAAMAPGATVLFVNSLCTLPGTGCGTDAMTWTIDNNLAQIVTTSYGLCEAGWGTTDLNTANALFKQANAQGQTVMAAAADAGATDCDAGPTAVEGLAVDYPSSSPYVTGLGGTQFNDGTATGATTYWSGTNATVGQGSALSYIPEAVWNDESLGVYGGGGGGASAYFTKPTWQVGSGVPADGARDVPDISLNSSNGVDPSLFCYDVALGSSCGSGFRNSTTDTTLSVVGGTSIAAPIFSGMLALIEQKDGLGQGNINPRLYALGNNTAYYTPGKNTLTLSTVVFNDVTTGNNANPCATGTPNCGNGGTEGYNATNGYDLATGWGSVNVTNLANAWNAVTPLGVGSLGANTSATGLTASTTSVVAGGTVTLTATVTGSGVTPTGTVQFYANNVGLGSAVALSSGTATYSWVTSCSALGQQVLSASYSGDVNYQGSRGPLLTANGGSQATNGTITTAPLFVQVASANCPDFTLSASSSALTAAAGGTIPSATITVTPINNFTGTVTFSALSTSTSGYAPTFTFSPASVNITSATAASTTLTLSGITASLQMPVVPGHNVPDSSGSKTPWYVGGSGIAMASLLMLMVPGRRRFSGLLMLALAAALIGGATGCSSSQTAPATATTTTNSNPYVGTYSVTVTGTYTATSGTITQHTAVVNYTIN